MILCYVKDEPFFKLAFRRYAFGKYLAFKVVACNEFGVVINPHASFPNIGKLKQWISLKSKPLVFL
jgi:hypothetical protein